MGTPEHWLEHKKEYPDFSSGNLAGLTILKMVEKPDNDLGPDEVILFTDGKTYLELDAQDGYEYHDCLASARSLDLRRGEEEWEKYNSWEVKKYG